MNVIKELNEFTGKRNREIRIEFSNFNEIGRWTVSLRDGDKSYKCVEYPYHDLEIKNQGMIETNGYGLQNALECVLRAFKEKDDAYHQEIEKIA